MIYIYLWILSYSDFFFPKEFIKGVGKDRPVFASLPSLLVKGVWGSLNRPYPEMHHWFQIPQLL